MDQLISIVDLQERSLQKGYVSNTFVGKFMRMLREVVKRSMNHPSNQKGRSEIRVSPLLLKEKNE